MNTNKNYVIFFPEEITNSRYIFKFLFVEKTKNETNYSISPLSKDLVFDDNLFYLYNQFLLFFDEKGIERWKRQIKEVFVNQKPNQSLELFAQKAFDKYLLEHLPKLFKYEDGLSFFHKQKVGTTNNYRNAPCKFKPNIPKIVFKVIYEDFKYSILSSVVIDEIAYNYNEFKRISCLLSINDDYFLLSKMDFRVLEWLDNLDAKYYQLPEREFAEQVLFPLEKTHEVDRNGYFEIEEIESELIPSIFFSEISGSFLMLTPVWNYDGFKVEGQYEPIYKTNKNGISYHIKRDFEKEKEFITKLGGLHPNFAKQKNGYFFLSFDEAKKKQWFLKAYHQFLLDGVELIGMDLLSHFRYAPFPLETEMKIKKTEGNFIFIKLGISVGNEQIALYDIQKILLAEQRTLLLKDNSLVVITDEFIDKYGFFIRHGKIQKDEICIPQWLLLLSDKSNADFPILQKMIKSDWWENWKKWQETEEEVFELPKGINATLRNYQHRGYEWMVLLSKIGAGACLADDMGLGKTLQTICFMAHLINETPGYKSVVVCPASLVFNWEKEFEKFAPHLKVYNFNDSKKNVENILQSEADIVILSYGLLRSKIEFFSKIPWLCAIIDESHNIKNIHSITSKAVCQLRSTHKVALSGTPIMNNTMDLYAQLNFLLPTLFGTREFFKKEYADPIDRGKSVEKAKLLSKITAPFLLRRTKEMVAKDLPEKIEAVLWCEMGEEQMEAYEAVKNKIRDSIFLNIKNEGLNKSKISVLAGMQKLRQVCNAPILVNDDEITNTDSIKLEVLMDEINNNLGGKKVLVFSQFKGMLDLIGDRLRQEKIKFLRFDGDTVLSERRDLIDQFQSEESDINIFIISLKAGNAGITLTAASYVFLIDPWWNSAVEQQAIDRTHRIGQTKNVFAYKMVCKDTIEEKIIALQQKKKAVSASIISVEEGFVKNLSEEDISYLFS